MRHGIFLTGGDGFVGRPLLTALVDLGRPVHALTRRSTGAPGAGVRGAVGQSTSAGTSVVHGDVLRPETYREALRSCDVVVHLAAATGRAPAATHFRVNAHGTDILLRACRETSVPHIVFVSSIATTFGDKNGYHYALAKLEAERSVARSGLAFAIVRPTIILGPGAPLLASLRRLALLPAIVVPGDGHARVQPVHVNDVVKAIVAIVESGRYHNETFDIGGPEVLTIETFLHRLREAETGATGRVVHVPLGMIRTPLRIAESIGLGKALPITAGQLASFKCDGIVVSDPAPSLTSGRSSLASMIADALAGSAEPRGAVAIPEAETLDAECLALTRHLLGCDPDAYVLSTYRSAHQSLAALAPATRFDGVLLGMARYGRIPTRVADAYAGVFARRSALRKKLVLLLAILETCSPFHVQIDEPISGGVAIITVRMCWRLTTSLLSLLAGTLILTPARLVFAMAPKGSR